MATYRYMATHLITGEVLADSLPLNVQSFSMQLNGSGSLTGSLDLQDGNGSYAVNTPFTEALEIRRAVIWVLRDNYPIWCGINLDEPDMTRANGGPLQVSAQTIDALWSRRLITDTLEYPQVDLYTVFLDLVNYGMTKQSPYIASTSPPATRPPAFLALMASNGGVANLVLPTGAAALAGVPWTAGYTYSDETQVASAWADMVASGNFEYVFLPGLISSSQVGIFVRLGFEQLGRPIGQAGYNLTYPGNALDYGWQRTGSQGSNVVWATAPPNGALTQWQSVYPHGVDLADLAAGYPVMESTVSWQGSTVTSQGQVNSFADGQLEIVTQGMVTPTINIGDDSYPSVADIVLGDSCWFSATSPRHPPQPGGLPGLVQQVRITGWTVFPPGPQQSAYTQLTATTVTSA